MRGSSFAGDFVRSDLSEDGPCTKGVLLHARPAAHSAQPSASSVCHDLPDLYIAPSFVTVCQRMLPVYISHPFPGRKQEKHATFHGVNRVTHGLCLVAGRTEQCIQNLNRSVGTPWNCNSTWTGALQWSLCCLKYATVKYHGARQSVSL